MAVSQAKIADMSALHTEQIHARVLEALASQKGLTDIMADLQVGAINDAFKGVDDGVTALVRSLGLADTAAGNFVQTLLSGLAKIALNKIFQQLFGVGASADGSVVAPQSSGGGFWSTLFHNLLGSAIGSLTGSFLGNSHLLGGVSTILSSGGSSNAAALDISTKYFAAKKATGGYITGAGTTTSDSIPAWLSNKEFVNNADSVQFYGVEVFNALNQKAIPKEFFSAGKFADGGYVGDFAPSDFSPPSN